MRVFECVVESGSFAGAARRLDMSPAAVTRAVASLEADLGARLVQRTTRRLSLTSMGEVFLEKAKVILRQMEEVDALVAAAVSEPKGRLRVLVPNAFAVHQLMPRLGAFHRRHPLVSIELTTGGCHEQADDAYDVSVQLVGGGWTLNNEFVARRLARSEAVACVQPEFAARCGRLARPEELAERDCLVYGISGHDTWQFDAVAPDAGEHVTVRPRPLLSTSDVGALLSAATAGLGYVGLPSFVVGDALRTGALVRLLPDWHVLTYELHAAVPNRKYVPARSKAFIDFLVGQFGGGEGDPWLASGRRRGSGVSLPLAA